MRIITFSHYLAHTQPLFIDLFLLPLDKLILNRNGIIMYEICNGLLPEVIHLLHVRNKDINSYNTRSSNLQRVPKGSSTRLWNVLLLNIDVNVSITTFKHNLKTYLLHNTVELKYPSCISCRHTIYHNVYTVYIIVCVSCLYIIYYNLYTINFTEFFFPQ